MGKWNRALTRAELSRVRLAHIAKLLLCFRSERRIEDAERTRM